MDYKPELSLEKAENKYPVFGKTVLDLDNFITALRSDSSLCTWLYKVANRELDDSENKTDNQLISWQRQTGMLARNETHDRIFPMETVEIKSFDTKHNADIEKALIHAGPSADEFARSLNALAITIGRDIYFRNGAYRPETEEGRSVLAHELTHVRQYDEKRITKNTTGKELEDEAVQEENKELYDPDPFISVDIDGEIFTLRKSELKKTAYEEAEELRDWLTHQRTVLSEEKYLELLCRTEQWTRGYSDGSTYDTERSGQPDRTDICGIQRSYKQLGHTPHDYGQRP